MDDNTRLTKTKEQWAKARRGGEEREVFYEGDARLPPGQHLVETWPVLDLGQKPDIPLSEWKLTIGVTKPRHRRKIAFATICNGEGALWTSD